MNKLTSQNGTRFMLSVFLTLCTLWSMAQNEVTSKVTTRTTSTTTWYAQPWVWVVGGAVFILLLIALLRSGSSGTDRTERVTVTKTTSTDV